MILKFIQVILLATVKFFLTLPYAMVIGLGYKEALIAVLVGGIGGFLFFYYISKTISAWLRKVAPVLCSNIPESMKRRLHFICKHVHTTKKIKLFSRKNRLIARFKKSYGLWGIVLATPLFLTIPVGAFLANKYYSHQPYIVLYMIMSIVGWTAVLSGVLHLFPKVFF